MRFYIDTDSGHSIHGWVVPDNPIAIGSVAVVIDGARTGEVPTRFKDDGIRSAGWHSTGQCRFMIEEAEFPGLADARRLEIFDVETNILIYRRVLSETVIQKKVVLINTSINPETVIQTAMFDHFQQSYFGIESFSDEVARSVFDSPWLTSSFQSGAILLPRFEGYFQSESTLTALLVHDPFIEMATRLTWLQARALGAADPMKRWRLGTLTDAAEFIAEFRLDDPKGLKRLFKTLPESVYHLLYNPLTRQCGTMFPGERFSPGHSLCAIEVLSRVGIIGHQHHFEPFVATLFDQLGIQAPVPAPEPIPAAIHALADGLRKIKLAQDMLIFDIAISDAVLSAVRKAWTAS